jgi:lysophospholipase L1-like esterase/mannose-6-phosphate isomerase-like protein (cupin superfamily)
MKLKKSLLAAALLAISINPAFAENAVRIFLAGDSTIAEKLPEKRPETGWGESLQHWFRIDDIVVVNHARNGRSTRTFIEEGRWDALLEAVRQGDYVFIQFGHNDQSKSKPKRYTPPDAFQANLRRFVADVRAREAIPVLLTPVVRRRFDEHGEFYDSHGAYPDLVRDVAESGNVALIDLHARSRTFLEAYGAERSKDLFLWLDPGDSPNYPEGLQDNTHFSPLGARAMASLVMQGILEQVPGLADKVQKKTGGVQHDSEIATPDGGPHQGGGETVGHWFFRESGAPFVFRKRIMHPGSSIGYHLHDKDEIYYIQEGEGELTFNGQVSIVGPGTAIFTRPGDSHGLKPAGDGDLVLIIVYEILDA